MEEKYIKLLVDKCLNFNKSNILFISYDKVNSSFVNKVKEYATKKEINVVLDEDDAYEIHEALLNDTMEEIPSDPLFDKSNWDENAAKYASFLMLESEIPGLMDDIEPDKIALASATRRNSRKLFRQRETTYEIPWCIAAFPNEVWAKKLFGDTPDAYKKLENYIYSMCMVDKSNPIEAWQEYMNSVKEKTDFLNDLKINKLHYSNSLGTNLTVEYPNDVKWSSVADDLDNSMIVNMPSYEIFTSPDYRKTEGIVYSSRPLNYNGGLIDDFYIEFHNGKAINSGAKVGDEILKGIINSDSNSCYLGETALVNNDSPISNTGIVFGTTLFDENASCHLALGNGFPDAIKGGLKMSKEELLARGINNSSNHVDFMIGTPDMQIEADTNKGKVLIFKNGNFVK